MNYDKELINRALEKAGQEPLTDEDISKNSARWRLIKSLYLPTILETLSNTDWTSQKKRIPLTPAEEENYTKYEFMYLLPYDCAKPEEICDEEEYLVEGPYLYTNKEEAILVYISNGKTIIPNNLKLSDPQPTEDTFEVGKYWYKDEEEWKPADEYDEEIEYFESKDDYPYFKDIDFNADPMLSLYIETRLAAKITLKITGNTQIYQLLFNESLLAEQNAIKNTQTHSHSKEPGNKYWGEIIGLGADNDNY